MIPSIISEQLHEFHKSNLVNIRNVGGGSINYCLQYEVNSAKFFLKFNDANEFPDIINNEVEGLHAIAATDSIGTPEVILHKTLEGFEFLVLPYIDQSRPSSASWKLFGEKLALLHKNQSGYFGWHHDNYIGSLRQSNTQHQHYLSFLIEERLQKQIDLACKQELLEHNDQRAFENLFKLLPNIIPEAKPSLVHGDLWSGNFMISNKGKPYLIDPSIQYSFRETDIAFTYLFGGFDQQFYDAYQECYPIAPGFQDRIKVYNLYPLLVHLNLFGKSYLSSIQSVLKIYS